jgi:hypothetical protein
MAALPIKITAAGYAALRNAQGNGTNAVVVATAGLTSTAFASGDAVPSEVKRVATIAGGATAADTIHVTISDTSGDAYSIRGFGLYLTDGTMLGSYGQADVIVEKSAQAAMLLAVDIQFADIDATQITFGDTNFSNPQATTERLGVVELATDDETTTGTDSTRVITPKSLLAALNARLGAGAPSTFVKSLLASATALAFRAALGLKSASTFDVGSGKGLDADLLDGQDGSFYQAYANLTGVPATFKPSPHQHDAGDINSGVFPVVRGGTGVATVVAGSFLVGAANGTDPMVPRTPAQVLGDIGAAAKQHSHQQVDIIGLSDSLAAKADKTALDAKVNKAGDTMSGDLVINRATSAVSGSIIGKISGKARWSFVPGDASNETGSNFGSNFGIGRYADDGTWLGYALAITRADSIATFAAQVTVGQNLTSSTGALVLAPTGAGAIYMRPNGAASSVGSWVVTNDGYLRGQTAGGGVKMYPSFGQNSFEVGYLSTTEQGLGGSFVDWNGNRTPALQIAAQSSQSAYMVWRATMWGNVHIAAMDAYYNGGNQMIAFHAGATNTHQMTRDGNFFATGLITASGGFNVSDRREKTEIRRMAVTRGIALKVARNFRSWKWKRDGREDHGVIAQWLQKHDPKWVREFTRNALGAKANGRKVKRLSVDKPGLALECSMDNALSIEELIKHSAALVRRIEKLERKSK